MVRAQDRAGDDEAQPDGEYQQTATNHRIPRWFAEGLAVHEETQASPEWGDPMTPDVVVALLEWTERLDGGRPAVYSQMVGHGLCGGFSPK